MEVLTIQFLGILAASVLCISSELSLCSTWWWWWFCSLDGWIGSEKSADCVVINWPRRTDSIKL